MRRRPRLRRRRPMHIIIRVPDWTPSTPLEALTMFGFCLVGLLILLVLL